MKKIKKNKKNFLSGALNKKSGTTTAVDFHITHFLIF